MIRCLAWLSLAGLTSCLLENDPDAPVKRLSELPSPHLLLTANSRTVGVTITFNVDSIASCPTLDDSFEAAVNGVPMAIKNRGVAAGSLYSSDPCAWPRLELDNPSAASTAMIVMSYPRHTISIDLADLLTPRSAQLVPDGPWTFTLGQTITVQWSPVSDLTKYTPSLIIDPDDGSRSSYPVATVVGDRMSFPLSDVTLPATLEITMQMDRRGEISWPCAGATCRLIDTPQFIHPMSP